jgi:predicted peptidase
MVRGFLCLALATVLILSAGCGPQGGSAPMSAAAPVMQADLAPGLHTLTMPRHKRPTIHYTISIPPRYRDNPEQVPLVIALHYGGDVKPFFGKAIVEDLVGPGLEELGAIIIAPDSLEGGQWNTPENDEAVLILVETALATYRIDKRKVLVTGFSLGGMGTWHFAGFRPDKFTAAIPIAGQPLELPTSPPRIPIHAIHSRQDDVMPLDVTQRRIARLQAAGRPAKLTIVDGASHYELAKYVAALRQTVPWLHEVWKK